VIGEPGPANLIVLEGHKRLTGLLLCPHWLPAEVKVMLGPTTTSSTAPAQALIAAVVTAAAPDPPILYRVSAARLRTSHLGREAVARARRRFPWLRRRVA
jgi:hypothetical protein